MLSLQTLQDKLAREKLVWNDLEQELADIQKQVAAHPGMDGILAPRRARVRAEMLKCAAEIAKTESLIDNASSPVRSIQNTRGY